jgi:zinc protease
MKGTEARTKRIDLDRGGVVLIEESHLVPIVSLTLALRSGSAHDPNDREGLFRLAGRMLRRGTEGLLANQIEDSLDRLGSEIGVDVGSSSFSLGGHVIGRNFDPFIDLVSELVTRPSFPEDELERLKRESVAELIEARDSDRTLAQRAFRRAMFPNHPYGRFSSGTVDSIPKMTREEAVRTHRTHFRRKNAILTFAGDVTEERAVAAAEKLLGGLADGEAIVDPTPAPAPLAGRRLVFVDKPDRTQTQILFGAIGTSAHDEDHIALLVANAVLGGTFTSRLMREVRSKRGWSYGASSRLAIDRQRQAFSMWTFPAANDAAPCIALELELLQSFVSDGITTKELAFIKKYLARSYAFEIDTATKRVHQTLDIELFGLPADYYSSHVAHVEAVTLEASQAAIKNRIDPANLVVVVVGTAKEILEPIQKAIPDLAATDVVPFESL